MQQRFSGYEDRISHWRVRQAETELGRKDSELLSYCAHVSSHFSWACSTVSFGKCLKIGHFERTNEKGEYAAARALCTRTYFSHVYPRDLLFRTVVVTFDACSGNITRGTKFGRWLLTSWRLVMTRRQLWAPPRDQRHIGAISADSQPCLWPYLFQR